LFCHFEYHFSFWMIALLCLRSSPNYVSLCVNTGGRWWFTGTDLCNCRFFWCSSNWCRDRLRKWRLWCKTFFSTAVELSGLSNLIIFLRYRCCWMWRFSFQNWARRCWCPWY
jgi:hypothetical protein